MSCRERIALLHAWVCKLEIGSRIRLGLSLRLAVHLLPRASVLVWTRLLRGGTSILWSFETSVLLIQFAKVCVDLQLLRCKAVSVWLE